MRFGISLCVLLLAGQFGLAQPKPTPPPEPKLEPKGKTLTDEQILKDAGFKTDPASLVEFFRKRTLADDERAKVQQLIKDLGAPVFRTRELASKDLVSRGPVVLEMLRDAMRNEALEIAKRAEICVKRIQEKDVAIDVPLAAVRLIGKQRPKETVETLLAYLPFADNDYIADEARSILSHMALAEGKAHPALVKGLADSLPVRRAAAGEVLARVGAKEQKDDVRKLLVDKDSYVRLRVAIALAMTGDREAPPVVIAAIPDLSVNNAWVAEDFLFRLAEGLHPPSVSPGPDAESKIKCRDAWQGWWKEHSPKIDLAKLKDPPRMLGNTLIVLLDLGKVMELGADNSVRWQVENLIFPLDAQLINDERFLVAEYHAHKVTERDMKGDVKWEKRVTGPLVAQRLENGNTFIVTDTALLEVNREGKETFTYSPSGGEKFMKGMKLSNGDMALLTNEARVVRLSPTGKELNSFTVSMSARLFGGRIHMLPSGRVLIPLNTENKVVEYDSKGKILWEVTVEQPVAATRLPNGNTLVTTMLPGRGAVEFDRSGVEVWSYRTFTRVTRALRR